MPRITFGELATLYMRHARTYYRHRDGSPTGEHRNIQSVLNRATDHFGNCQVDRLTRHAFRAWIDQLVAADLSRPYVNACLSRLRRVINWANELDYVDDQVVLELRRVRPLPAHRSAAREPVTKPLPQVDEIAQILPHLPPIPRALVQQLVLTGARVGELLNIFASSKTAEQIREEPHRFLVCADKFQTGYTEPPLQTMYVDKPLSGIKAVQTLSCLNRAHPQKHDVFVLDFQNEAEVIRMSFDAFYRTTILSEETDPNKLHVLQGDLDESGVYGPEHIGAAVAKFMAGADRDAFEDVLDACRDVYTDRLDEDEQVKFKGDAKSFVRTYEFLGSILPFINSEWEKRSIFLNLLIPKLPSPKRSICPRASSMPLTWTATGPRKMRRRP